MTLPNFVVLGAAKCGTTSLYHYLRQHPQVYLPERKELHYFSYEELRRNSAGPGDADLLARFCATRREYEAHYDGADAPAIGDVSPSYFYFTDVYARIRDELRAPRVLLLLRDPVQKAFSQYMMLVRANRERLTFAQGLDAEPARIRDRWAVMWRYADSSLYARRVERCLETFGPERVRILRFEDFAADPACALRQVFGFLGVDPDFQPDVSRVYNRSGRPRSRLVADLLRKPGAVKRAVRRVLPAGLLEGVQQRLRDWNTGAKETLDARSRERLRERFSPDVEEVERALGWESGSWLR